MSHAEAVHTLRPAAGATDQIVQFTAALRHDALPEEGAALRAAASARHRRRDDRGRGRHHRDASRDRDQGGAARRQYPVPGRARRADLLDAAFLGGTAAHGIELDDGYRHGSAHCGCVVIPAVLALGYDRHVSGRGADRGDRRRATRPTSAIGRACAPDLRQRGFHPTPAVGRSALRWRPASCAA